MKFKIEITVKDMQLVRTDSIEICSYTRWIKRVIFNLRAKDEKQAMFIAAEICGGFKNIERYRFRKCDEV